MYAKTGKLRKSRGKYHDYLEMFLDFRKEGKQIVDMRKYLKDTYKMFTEELGGYVTSPAADHLYNVNYNFLSLDEKRKQNFHTITARTYFFKKLARPDLLPTVSFLCTRLQGPDIDDWKS